MARGQLLNEVILFQNLATPGRLRVHLPRRPSPILKKCFLHADNKPYQNGS